MAAFVDSNSHAIEQLGPQDSSGGGASVDQETGLPIGYHSSGYNTASSEARTPNSQPKRMDCLPTLECASPPRPVPLSPSDSAHPTPSHVRFEQHPQTGQMEQLRRRRPKPLVEALKRTRELEPATRKRLAEADELLSKGKFAEAVPCLEAGLIGVRKHPKLQSLVWMCLGNAHAAVGRFKKASVCHMHYLAFCKELQDFKGMTKAECNLGIAYMKLGLLKLAGRCFLQFLENSRLLEDEMSVASAYSNLGMLSKALAEHSYQSAVKEGDKGRAVEALNTNMRRAITYFEHHLEIVEGFGDL